MPVQSYLTPTTWDQALEVLATPAAVAVGGGTDVVPLMRDGIADPETVVDLRHLPGATSITWGEGDCVRVGASVTLDTLARDPRVRATFPALAQAAASAGSAALREAGTLGGNLCQRVRCWYFRGDHPCLRRGGSFCSAEVGENQYHGIFRSGGCVVAHPSDCATVLVATGATIHLRSAAGSRDVAAADFLVPSSIRLDGETCLQPGEVVEGVTLPSEAAGGLQFYDKQMQRTTWDFALVALAGARRRDGGVRLVLGGVANVPWRVNGSVEEDVASGGLGEDDIDTLAQRALYDASPLSQNAYKLDVASALVRRAIARLAPG